MEDINMDELTAEFALQEIKDKRRKERSNLALTESLMTAIESRNKAMFRYLWPKLELFLQHDSFRDLDQESQDWIHHQRFAIDKNYGKKECTCGWCDSKEK